MSHFTVLVVTDTPDEAALSAALQPFHEYECTGTKDEYVVWVTDEDATIRKEWAENTADYWVKDGEVFVTYDARFYRDFTPTEEDEYGPLSTMGCGCDNRRSWSSRDWGDGEGYRAKIKMTDEEIEAMGYVREDRLLSEGHTYKCIEDYAKDYYGYEARDGKFGRWTNPSAQWDWWRVGGRWSGKLLTHGGARVDHGYKREMDFDTKRIAAERAAALEWDAKAEIIRGRELVQFKTYLDKFKGQESQHKKAREEYWAQDVLVDLKEAYNKPFEEWPRFFLPREDFIRTAGENAVATFAFLGTDGEWKQRGDMGWWGCVSDEKDDWGEGFMGLLNSIKPDQYIWVVDCHI